MTAIAPTPIRVPLGASAHRPDVIAHRGFPAAGAYENTMPAFIAALDAGADKLETDVRRTRDGTLVLHHDPDVDGAKIADLDFAQLPATPGGAPIPRLTALADLARARGARLVVEIKEPGYEAEVLRQLAASLPPEQVEIISFSKKSIRAVEQIQPAVRTGLIVPMFPGCLRVWPFFARLLDSLHLPTRAAARTGADFISANSSSVSSSFLDDAERRDLDVTVWTVNDSAQLERLLADPRVDGVVTDRTDEALRLRDRVMVPPRSIPA